MAKATEDLGFDAFFRSDHYLTMGGDGLPGPTDAWITLAGLARETSRIRLGTLVTAGTFRLPGVLAISVAQVDQMSGGRVELGLGTGWYDGEHTAYGIPFPSLGERFDRFEEQLEIITGLWSAEGSYSFSGKHYQLVDCPALPKPTQAHGRRSSSVASGRSGPRGSPRPTPTSTTSRSTTSTTPGRPSSGSERPARRPAGRSCCRRRRSSASARTTPLERRAAKLGRDVEGLRRDGLAGSPAEVVDKLGQFAEAGATRVYLQVMDLADLDHLELIASEVLPHV